MVDIEKVLKNTVKKGKVKIGAKQTKQVINDKSAKLVIMANNCPYINEINKLAKNKKIPIYNYKSNSIDLGYTCGKAFAVSVFAVLDDGGSNINQLIKKGN
jgi:large subunit ribosomal protein L30e